MLLAMSNAAVAGIFSVVTAFIGASATVAVILFGRDTHQQSGKANRRVGEFERAYRAMQQERSGDRDRIAALERREDECLEALTDALSRIAVLEAMKGVRPGERH